VPPELAQAPVSDFYAEQRDCVFCRIIRGEAGDDRPESVLGSGGMRSVILTPLNPVVPGHKLVIPARHVRDALVEPVLTGVTFSHAAAYAALHDISACNIMTSVGAAATQTVFHMHVHIVPRVPGDGLMLPWTEQQAREKLEAELAR
jgi:histidine triad (HIT) family protein